MSQTLQQICPGLCLSHASGQQIPSNGDSLGLALCPFGAKHLTLSGSRAPRVCSKPSSSSSSMHHPASHMRMSSTQDDTSVPLKSHLLGLIGLMNFGRFVENKCDFSRIKSPPSVGHQLWKMPFQSLQRSLSTTLNKGPLEILTRGHYGMCNAQYCFTIYLGYSSKGQFFSDIHEHRMGLLPGGEDEQGKTERNKEKEKCFRAEHSYL